MTLNEARRRLERVKDPSIEIVASSICGVDLEENLEKEYNRACQDLHSALLLLEDWLDLGVAISGTELMNLLGSAYDEFREIKSRTFQLLKDYDLTSIRQSMEGESS